MLMRMSTVSEETMKIVREMPEVNNVAKQEWK